MKKSICMAAALFVAGAFAQTPTPAPAPRSEPIIRVFPIHYVSIKKVRDVISLFGADLRGDESMGVLAARGSPETLDAIEQVIKRLDVASGATQNAEIDVYMLMGSQTGSSGSLPKELDPVVKQMKGLFSYQNYRLLDTAAIRSGEGAVSKVNGILPARDEGMPGNYELIITGLAISPAEKERSMHFSLRLNLKVPLRTSRDGNYSFRDVGIETAVDVREGQKVVVGKSNIDGSNDALVLVLTAKLVN